MRVIFIDTEKRTITEIKDFSNDWKDIAPKIGNGCTTFTVPVNLPNGDAMYADDEGLFNEIKGGLMMDGWSYPIVGNVLIIGTDDETGDSIDAKSTVMDLSFSITFVPKERCEKWVDYFR